MFKVKLRWSKSSPLLHRVASLICTDLGKSEFLNIHIFNWHKALDSACSGISRHLDFIRAIGITSGSFQLSAFVWQAAMSS